MRLFAGIPVVGPAHQQIAGLLGMLRDRAWPVRWVRDEGLHLTLKFYGEVAPERLDVIAESVRYAAQGCAPLSLRLGELGAFPSIVRPRVIWVEVEGPADLPLLQDRLERGGEAIGFPPEGGPFRPHLTLGRVREGHRLPPHGITGVADAYERVPFVGGRLVLYESVLTTGGPRYEPRLTLELAG